MNLATRMMISLVIVFLEILFLLGKFDGPYLFLGFWIGLPLAYVLRHVVHPRIHHRHLSRQFLAFLCCITGALMIKKVFGIATGTSDSKGLFLVMVVSFVVWLIRNDISIYRQMSGTGVPHE